MLKKFISFCFKFQTLNLILFLSSPIFLIVFGFLGGSINYVFMLLFGLIFVPFYYFYLLWVLISCLGLIFACFKNFLSPKKKLISVVYILISLAGLSLSFFEPKSSLQSTEDKAKKQEYEKYVKYFSTPRKVESIDRNSGNVCDYRGLIFPDGFKIKLFNSLKHGNFPSDYCDKIDALIGRTVFVKMDANNEVGMHNFFGVIMVDGEEIRSKFLHKSNRKNHWHFLKPLS